MCNLSRSVQRNGLIALIVAGVIFFSSIAGVAQSVEKAKALCYEIQNYTNALADFTQTSCLPSSGKVPGAYSFIILSNKPIFSGEATKKAWLLVVVASVGKILNENSNLKAGDVFLSDSILIKDRKCYLLSGPLVKTLQRKVKTDQMDLDGMYRAILKNMRAKAVKEAG
jgi:hypothetical protein